MHTTPLRVHLRTWVPTHLCLTAMYPSDNHEGAVPKRSLPKAFLGQLFTISGSHCSHSSDGQGREAISRPTRLRLGRRSWGLRPNEVDSSRRALDKVIGEGGWERCSQYITRWGGKGLSLSVAGFFFRIESERGCSVPLRLRDANIFYIEILCGVEEEGTWSK